VPIYAPNQASSFYNDLGLVGRKFLRLAWQGLVAVDLLEKAAMQTRPYETEPGAVEAVFQECLREVCDTLATDYHKLPAALRRSRDRFAQVTVDRGRPRPIIGLVGEFYVRASAFSNQDLVRKLEALGAEVWSAPVYEWFLYRNFRRDMRAAQRGDWRLRLKNWAMDHFMHADEKHLVAAFDGFLVNAHEPPAREVLAGAAPYVHYTFEGEAIMTVGKAVDFAQKGLAGIVSVMPFTCMPGTISQAIMRQVRADHDQIPFLNMVYDGLEQATAETRLEAFMAQAREYLRRRGAEKGS